jgi:hypothetical protein
MFLDPVLQEYYVLLDVVLNKNHEGHEEHKKQLINNDLKIFVNLVPFVVESVLS